MTMAKDAGAPLSRFGMAFDVLTMLDFATLQGMEGNEDKTLNELMRWIYTPRGTIAALAISGAKGDPLFTEQQAAELADPVALLGLASDILARSIPDPEPDEGRAEGNGESMTLTG